MIDSLFKRAIAYFIDMMLVSLVVNSLISSSMVNFQLDTYQDIYKEYTDFHNLYVEQYNNDIKTCENLEKAFSNKKITEEKYINSYEDLKSSVDSEEITKEEYDSKCLIIVDNYNDNKITEDEYLDKVTTYSYNLEKKSSFNYIINIIACLLYFVLFQGFTNGQTLGKKIMRLKVVSDDGQEKISYKRLFIRTLFLYSIIYYLALTISVSILSESAFTLSFNILYMLNYILSLVLVFMIGVNSNRRGLHDVVAKTKVIELDFKGNEIKRKKKSFFGSKKHSDSEVQDKDDSENEEKKNNKSGIIKNKKKK